MTGDPYPAARREYTELAQAIANQAQALADGTHTAPRFAVVALLMSNIDTLRAWTPDDREIPGREGAR